MSEHDWFDLLSVGHCQRCGAERVDYGYGGFQDRKTLYHWPNGVLFTPEENATRDVCLGDQLARLMNAEAEVFMWLLGDGNTVPQALRLAQVVLP